MVKNPRDFNQLTINQTLVEYVFYTCVALKAQLRSNTCVGFSPSRATQKKRRGPTLGPLAYISIVCCSLALYHAAANELVAIVPRGKLTRCNAPLRLIEEYV